MALETIQCNSCGSPLARENIDRRRATLDCASCGSVHDLYKPAYRNASINGELIDNILASQTELLSAKRTLSHKPRSFKTRVNKGRLKIEFPAGDYLWAMAITGSLVILLMLLNSWGEKLFIVLAVILVIWAFICSWFLRRLGITVTEDSLTLTQSNVYGQKTHTLPAKKIRQLFVQQQHFKPDPLARTIASAMDRQATRDQTQEEPVWNVRLLTDDDTIIDLIKSLPTREEALFLEQEIETRLGVRDAPVGGEVAL